MVCCPVTDIGRTHHCAPNPRKCSLPSCIGQKESKLFVPLNRFFQTALNSCGSSSPFAFETPALAHPDPRSILRARRIGATHGHDFWAKREPFPALGQPPETKAELIWALTKKEPKKKGNPKRRKARPHFPLPAFTKLEQACVD